MKGKRKSSEKETTSNKSTSKRHKSGDDYNGNTIFDITVKEAGLYLKNGHTNNLLSVDQTVFLKNLERKLKYSLGGETLINDMITGFQEYAENADQFHHCFLPTLMTKDCTASSREGNHDSVARLLLRIEQLQMPLMDHLLEKLVDYTDNNDCVTIGGSKINIPNLMLSQFRWLDKIVDSKKLANKMLDLVTVTPVSIQQELIGCLPEIIDDAEHCEIALTLKDLLLKDKALTIPILDALGNLNIKEELLSEIRNSVLPMLASIDVDNLPILIRFILDSVPVNDMATVVSAVRKNLDFHSLVAPACASTPNTSRSSDILGKTDRDYELLVLDAIKSQIRFQKNICDAWIKAIEDLSTPAEHKVFDIFIILILYGTSKKKAVESLVRNKIRASCFSEVLLQTAFSSHAGVIVEYFSTVLSLAEALLRSCEPSINYFACFMYRMAFVAFDSYGRQELVGNLVSHIGSGIAAEIDSSLDILTSLTNENITRLAPFVIIVRGILDYLDNMTVTQIHKLYSILSKLAFCNPSDSSLIRDDLHIVIRKQLSKNDLKYKRMGIIGAVMIIKSLSSKDGNNADKSISFDNSDVFSDEMFKEVKSLLQLVRSSSAKIPEASALFMDELAVVIGRGAVNSRVQNLINENVSDDFLNNFVVDLDSDVSKASTIVPMEKLFGLDDESEGNIAINLLSLVESDFKKSTSTTVISPVCLAPHFRLLCMCERVQSNGNLEQIDALLGCPLFTVQEETVDKMKSLSNDEKNIFCTTIFYTINWFRELINGFSLEKDPDMKTKMISRLVNITNLQELLLKSLAANPGYCPPQALFDNDVNATPPPAKSAKSGRKRKRPGKKSDKENDNEDSDEDDDDKDDDSRDSVNNDNNSTTTQISQTKKVAESENQETTKLSADNLLLYRCFFREFDLSVFQILSVGLITNASLDSQLNANAQPDVQLKPPQLELLLSDLNLKLSHALIGNKSPRRSFLKTKGDKNVGYSNLDQFTPREIIDHVILLLPSLCQHLEAVHEFFQMLLTENDGIVDGAGSGSVEAQKLSSCYQLLLQIFLTIFSWNGFLSVDRRPVLKKALLAMVTRFEPNATSQKSSHEMFKVTFQYIENLTSTLQNLNSAVVILKLLVVICERSNIEAFKARISSHAEGFLKRLWLGSDGERDKGAKFNENLQFVILTYLNFSEDKMTQIEEIATKGMEEILKLDKNESTPTYQTLNRSSYPVYYRAMLVELLDLSKRIQPGSKSDAQDVKLDKLLSWNRIVRVVQIMVKLIKTFDSRSNLMTILKYTRVIIDVFLRLGMPLLDQVFRNHQTDVQSLLKHLQISTRSLHHICGHSKIVKDVSLTNQVPMVKRTLEAFVYRVKAMLTMNKCLDAFWMGNLKNRDLQGEEILSQVAPTQDESEGEDEVPEEEDSEVEADATEAPQDSYSQCY